MPDLWHWTPNGMKERLEFKTDIRISRTKEIRDSYKDATQRLTYSHTVAPNVAEKMIDRVRANPTGLFSVPVWPLATFSKTNALSETDTTATVDDENAYVIGQKVYIGYGNETWEQVTVTEKSLQQITFTPGLSRDYSVSANMKVAIAPVVDCIAPEGLSFSSRFPVKDLTITFLSLEPEDMGANPYSTFDGIPLLPDGGVPFSSLQGSMSQTSNLVDSHFGFYEMIETEEFPRRRGTMSALDTQWLNRFKTRQFLHFMRGRDGEAWFPTGQRDVILTANISSSTLSTNIRPIAAATRMVGKNLLFREKDLRVAREITSATDVSTTVQTIGFASLGANFTSKAGVSLLHRCRFDTDAFELQYQFTPHGLACRLSAPVIEVP